MSISILGQSYDIHAIEDIGKNIINDLKFKKEVLTVEGMWTDNMPTTFVANEDLEKNSKDYEYYSQVDLAFHTVKNVTFVTFHDEDAISFNEETKQYEYPVYAIYDRNGKELQRESGEPFLQYAKKFVNKAFELYDELNKIQIVIITTIVDDLPTGCNVYSITHPDDVDLYNDMFIAMVKEQFDIYITEQIRKDIISDGYYSDRSLTITISYEYCIV